MRNIEDNKHWILLGWSALTVLLMTLDLTYVGMIRAFAISTLIIIVAIRLEIGYSYCQWCEEKILKCPNCGHEKP